MPGLIATYEIQEFLFKHAAGRYEIDLAESGVQPRSLDDLEPTVGRDLNYGTDRGLMELREQVAALYGVDADRVLIANGAQEALFLFYVTRLRPRDHVVTFIPGWQQSTEVPLWLGADVTRIRMDRTRGYRIAWDSVGRELRPDTRLLSLNMPHNPTGIGMDDADWDRLRAIAGPRRLAVVNDEEYVLDHRESVVHRLPGSFSVGGLSKVFGFPGLRVGWCVGDRDAIEAMVNFKRYVTVCNSPLCERYAAQVLHRRAEFQQDYVRMCSSGLDRLRAWTARHALTMVEPAGTPFAYIRLDLPVSSREFAGRLLRRKRVLVMPAEVFGDEGAIRVSFGRPEQVLAEGLSRIGEELRRYSR